MPLREKQRAQRKLEKRSSNKVSSTGFLPNRAKVFIESSVAIYHEEYNFPLHLLPAPESLASSISFSIPAVIRNTLGYRWSEAELILEPCFCDHGVLGPRTFMYWIQLGPGAQAPNVGMFTRLGCFVHSAIHGQGKELTRNPQPCMTTTPVEGNG